MAGAELTIIDLETERPIKAEEFASKSSNTPFIDEVVSGYPIMTIYDGEIVYEEAVKNA